jgi:polyisoprenoid-binding protein YceI
MRAKLTSLFLALFAAILALPAVAADTFKIDSSHTDVGFAVSHMVISKVKGTFTDVAGTIIYAPEDLSQASVDVTIKVASIDTSNADRDAHLRGEDFFHADEFPHVTFTSARIEPRGDAYLAHGHLTIRGVRREVVLPFRVTGVIQDPWGQTRMGVEVEPITIDRTDFGVSWSKSLDSGGLVVGNEVRIEVSVEAVKAK